MIRLAGGVDGGASGCVDGEEVSTNSTLDAIESAPGIGRGAAVRVSGYSSSKREIIEVSVLSRNWRRR